jgi:hypothetical protein
MAIARPTGKRRGLNLNRIFISILPIYAFQKHVLQKYSPPESVTVTLPAHGVKIAILAMYGLIVCMYPRIASRATSESKIPNLT